LSTWEVQYHSRIDSIRIVLDLPHLV
jgi:hypothetical protein